MRAHTICWRTLDLGGHLGGMGTIGFRWTRPKWGSRGGVAGTVRGVVAQGGSCGRRGHGRALPSRMPARIPRRWLPVCQMATLRALSATATRLGLAWTGWAYRSALT